MGNDLLDLIGIGSIGYFSSSYFFSTRLALCPPKPRELDMAYRSSALPALVGHDVQIAFRVRGTVVDGSRNKAVLKCPGGDDHLDGTCRTQQMTGHRLGGARCRLSRWPPKPPSLPLSRTCRCRDVGLATALV